MINIRKLETELWEAADLLRADEVGVHPCLNTASLAVAVADILEKFLPHTGHRPTTVHLVGE